VLVDLPQQQQPTVTAEIPTTEICLDDASSKTSEIVLGIRTLWHRQSSVGIGVSYL
jgi:hypothetical protein